MGIDPLESIFKMCYGCIHLNKVYISPVPILLLWAMPFPNYSKVFHQYSPSFHISIQVSVTIEPSLSKSETFKIIQTYIIKTVKNVIKNLVCSNPHFYEREQFVFRKHWNLSFKWLSYYSYIIQSWGLLCTRQCFDFIRHENYLQLHDDNEIMCPSIVVLMSILWKFSTKRNQKYKIKPLISSLQ